MGIESISQAPCVYFSGETKVYTIPQAIAKVKPRRVVMTFGTNNASGQFTRESFIDAYRDAIAAIQDAYPYCDVIINAIPPIGKVRSYPDITMETLDDFNKALEELAQELGLPFLNSSEALKGGDGYAKPDYVIGDGLHLSQAALEELLFYTRTHAYEAEDRRPVAAKSTGTQGSACLAGRCGSIRRRAGELTGCFQKINRGVFYEYFRTRLRPVGFFLAWYHSAKNDVTLWGRARAPAALRRCGKQAATAT